MRASLTDASFVLLDQTKANSEPGGYKRLAVVRGVFDKDRGSLPTKQPHCMTHRDGSETRASKGCLDGNGWEHGKGRYTEPQPRPQPQSQPDFIQGTAASASTQADRSIGRSHFTASPDAPASPSSIISRVPSPKFHVVSL